MPNWQFCCKNSNGTQFAPPIIKGIKKIFTMQKEDKTTKTLIDKIVEGIQEKKGKGITIVDMEKLGNSICDYFVICQGNSPAQVSAITDSVEDVVRIGCKRKPYAIDGLRNAQWVAMDYGDVLVHVFLPDVRAFYDIEHLWADAKITNIPDLD
jgi:ribosome-associated protein